MTWLLGEFVSFVYYPTFSLLKHRETLLPFTNPKLFLLLAGRGSFGICAMLCYYNSFQYLPIGDASTLMFCSSVVLSILSWFFLGETMDCIDGMLLSLSLIHI